MNSKYYFHSPYITKAEKRIWHSLTDLPSPGIPLMVRLDDGTEIKAIRPTHVKNRKVNPDFRNHATKQPLNNVVQWAIF